MKIGIDCRLAGKKHAGLGRYTAHLVRELATNCAHKNDELVLFFSNQKQAAEVVPQKTKVPCKIILTPIKHYSLKEQFVLPWHFYKEKLDVLHVPHFNISLLYWRPLVVTIHDLLWHEKRGGSVTTLHPLMYWIKYLFYHLVTSTAVSRAVTVFVPSKTVADTVTKHYPRSASKITITKEGTSLIAPTKVPIRKKKQLLYVGSLYPHKNIQLVIDALKKLPKTQLIIVGARNVFLKKVEQYVTDRKLQNRVSFKGYVSDDELTKLYLESTALVQPSLSEGFGLTGLEALGLQTPVLASDIPIFHEIYADAALYFNPHSVDEFISAYRSLQKRSDKNFKRAASAVVRDYSWNTMACATYKKYQEANETS